MVQNGTCGCHAKALSSARPMVTGFGKHFNSVYLNRWERPHRGRTPRGITRYAARWRLRASARQARFDASPRSQAWEARATLRYEFSLTVSPRFERLVLDKTICGSPRIERKWGLNGRATHLDLFAQEWSRSNSNRQERSGPIRAEVLRARRALLFLPRPIADWRRHDRQALAEREQGLARAACD